MRKTTDDFRFAFLNFPPPFSHQKPRCVIGDDLAQAQFLPGWRRWKRVLANTGCSCPPPFGPRDLPALWQFLDAPSRHAFTYGVEVRHPCF